RAIRMTLPLFSWPRPGVTRDGLIPYTAQASAIARTSKFARPNEHRGFQVFTQSRPKADFGLAYIRRNRFRARLGRFFSVNRAIVSANGGGAPWPSSENLLRLWPSTLSAIPV